MPGGREAADVAGVAEDVGGHDRSNTVHGGDRGPGGVDRESDLGGELLCFFGLHRRRECGECEFFCAKLALTKQGGNKQRERRFSSAVRPRQSPGALCRFALQTSVNPGNFVGFIGGGTNNLNNSIHTTINDTHVFSANIVNEARIGYSRHNGSFKVAGIDDGLKFAEQNNIAVYPFPIRMFPNIVFSPSGLTSGSNTFTALGSGGPNLNIENTYQISDDLTWRHVNHVFKMGADYRRRQFDVNFGGGQTVFGSIFSASSDDAGSGNPLADFLLGYPSQVTGTQLLDWARMRDSYAGAYFQDDWKVSTKLTLNLGVRYERFAQPIDARDRGSLFDTRTGKFVVPQQAGYSRAIVDSFNKNFAPRFGFAYTMSNRLTVRGGAGVFFGQRSPNQQTTVFGSNPPNAPAVITPTVSATTTLTPPMTISTPIQVGPATADLSTFTPANSLGLSTPSRTHVRP